MGTFLPQMTKTLWWTESLGAALLFIHPQLWDRQVTDHRSLLCVSQRWPNYLSYNTILTTITLALGEAKYFLIWKNSWLMSWVILLPFGVGMSSIRCGSAQPPVLCAKLKIFTGAPSKQNNFISIYRFTWGYTLRCGWTDWKVTAALSHIPFLNDAPGLPCFWDRSFAEFPGIRTSF